MTYIITYTERNGDDFHGWTDAWFDGSLCTYTKEEAKKAVIDRVKKRPSIISADIIEIT